MNLSTAVKLPRMLRLVRSRDSAAGPSSQMSSRIEVCPPELWPSSIGWRATLRRCIRRAPWLSAPARPSNRLAQVKQEFREAAADLPLALLDGLDDRIERARSLREFWHLRSSLYHAVAVSKNQIEAERRLARLNRHFPTRAPRTSATPA